MKKIIMVDGQYQELRKHLLSLAGEEVQVIFKDNSLVWKWHDKEYQKHNCKVVDQKTYVKNMLENEIHQIYNLLRHGGIPTKIGNGGIKMLPCKIKNIKSIDITQKSHYN